MHPSRILLLWTLLLVILGQAKPNLHIGTGGFGFGCGSNSPAAQVPYSFVRVGPDTSPMNSRLYKKFQHYGGYHDSDHWVRAFSHLHLVGAGVLDMGVFGFLPLLAKNQNAPPPVNQDKIVPMSKQDQIAQPGFYSTYLPHQKIKIELTSTQRCAAHRYTSLNPSNKPMDIHMMTSYLLDTKSPRSSLTQICGQNCVEGRVHVMGGFGGRFGGYTLHYHAEVEAVLGEGHFGVFLYKGTEVVGADVGRVEGNHTGAVIRTKANVVQILVGISYVSIQNARLNFQNQVKGKSFNTLKSESQKTWQTQLSRFSITTISPQTQTKLDTAIYRSLLTPTIFQDSNRQYLSFRNDGTIETLPSNMKHIYTDMSIWDVHRTQMPWILLHDAERFRDVAMSIVVINREGGYMPKWPFAQGATGCMIGAHANTVLADWIVKEAYKTPEKYNISEIFEFMLRNANKQTPHDSRSNPTQYIKLGYIPVDKSSRSSCSQTLQYSYNDFSISQIASLLNNTQAHQQFTKRSKFYKNLFNPKTKFFQPKYANGTFKKISPLERINIFSNNYVEGDAWHYRFYAPHDAPGLIQLFGGEKSFVRELSRFFGRSPTWPTFWLPNPYYWPGNQHDLFSVWLFPYANRSDLTEKYTRQIVENSYGLDGSGLPGNDDYATMSAWLIFATLGFYPLPSTQTYILGSPQIHYARIDRKISQNETIPFRIRVNNNSKSNEYVRKVEINKRQTSKFINHTEISDPNVVLEFWMEHRDVGGKVEEEGEEEVLV